MNKLKKEIKRLFFQISLIPILPLFLFGRNPYIKKYILKIADKLAWRNIYIHNKYFHNLIKETKEETSNLSLKLNEIEKKVINIQNDACINHHDLKSLNSNINYELQKIATSNTAHYVIKHMSNVESEDSWEKVHKKAFSYLNSDGLFLEFGVYSGRTINYIADIYPDKYIHGFDSFEGLPEFWRDGFDKGHFKLDQLPDVKKNVILHKGWFDVSIPKFLSTIEEEKISFLHIDCDLYSSTKTIFDLLGHLISDGTIIVFDEYFNYNGWEKGEFKAFQEFISASKFTYEYITYNHLHEQVAVRITDKTEN